MITSKRTYSAAVRAHLNHHREELRLPSLVFTRPAGPARFRVATEVEWHRATAAVAVIEAELAKCTALAALVRAENPNYSDEVGSPEFHSGLHYWTGVDAVLNHIAVAGPVRAFSFEAIDQASEAWFDAQPDQQAARDAAWQSIGFVRPTGPPSAAACPVAR